MAFSSEPLAVELPSVEVEAYISDFFGEVSLPAIEINAAGGTAWEVSITLPALTLQSDSSFGWDASFTLPELEIAATGITSRLLSGVITLPQVSITASAKRSGSGSLSVPQLTINATGHTVIDWDANNLEVPQITINAFAESVLASVFEIWCMNMASAGVSEYTNYPITSVTRFNGTYYATTSTGIVKLSGDTDAGTAIDSDVLSGMTDYSYEGERGDNSLRVKRSGGAYVNLRSQGGFAVVAKVDEDKERIYTLSAAADPKGFHPRRVDVGRLLEGRNWQFGFRNISGADFYLRNFQNIPIILSRRL
jgi:hypothetical protein